MDVELELCTLINLWVKYFDEIPIVMNQNNPRG